MRLFYRFLFATLLAGIFAAQPLPAAAQTDAQQPDGTIAVQNVAGQDAAIAARLRNILAGLSGYDDVTVEVSSGIVTLRGTALDGESMTRLADIAARVEGVVAIENEVTESADVAERLNPAVARFRARLTHLVAMLPLFSIALIAAGLIAALGFWIARLRWPLDRIAPNAFIADIYRQILRIVFVIAGIVVGLDILGATALLSTILGAAGIAGLAIGFAVRDTVENFIASVLLSMRQPFRPNDVVEIEGDIGKVIRLTSRATILLSFDGNHIRIPNATVFKARIVNFTRNDERRFTIDLGVASDTNLSAAQELALNTVTSLPFILDEPAAQVWIETLGDSAVILRVAAWISQAETSHVLARSEATRLCLIAFAKADIDMPEPSFRLVGATGAAPQAKPITQSKSPDSVPPETAPQKTNASAEAQLDRIIDEERKHEEEKDLLNHTAPSE